MPAAECAKTGGSTMKTLFLAAAFTAAANLAPVHAAVITEDRSGVETSADWLAWGQTFTTPSGGPWNNITFNFYDASGAPSAGGTSYILSAPYFGTPNDLPNASTILAASVMTSGGRFIFAPGFTLQPNTRYHDYNFNWTDALVGNGHSYTGGSYAFSTGWDQPFQHPDTNDMNFTVGGTAVPEPASWALLIVGFGLTGVAMRRRTGLAVASA
jgi:hypothetical protein